MAGEPGQTGLNRLMAFRFKDKRKRPRQERRLKASLYGRVLIASSILLAAVTTAITGNSIRIIKNTMLENIRISERQTSEMLNLAVSPYAVVGDFSTMQIFLDELLGTQRRDYGLSYLVIGQEDGRILLRAGALESKLPEPDTPDSYSDAIQRGTLHIRHPLLLENNTVGFLQYGFSFELVGEATERLIQETTVLVIVGLLIISGILLWITFKIVRRINALANTSLAIARGDYSQRASEKEGDEISLLAGSFNDMAAAIQQRVQEVTLLNRELESRVEIRTQELVELNQALQKTIDELKWAQENLIRSEKLAGLGSLVAGVAHELNTPIGNALTVATTLQDHTRSLAAEFKTGLRRASLENFLTENQTAGELIVRNLQRAANLVTSFKHVAVDQTSENRRQFELRPTVEEIVATLSPILKKTPYLLDLDISPGIMLNSYPGALGQILTNLVNNAVFHAFSERDHGNMRLSAAHLPNEKVRIVFEDDGHGMSPLTLKRIFDPFFTTRLGQGGSGLGMNIVHNLVCGLLKGDISAESELGEGSRFIIELPLEAD